MILMLQTDKTLHNYINMDEYPSYITNLDNT